MGKQQFLANNKGICSVDGGGSNRIRQEARTLRAVNGVCKEVKRDNVSDVFVDVHEGFTDHWMNRKDHPQDHDFLGFTDGIRLKDVVGDGHDQTVLFFSEIQFLNVMGSEVTVSNVTQPPANLG